MLSSLLTDCYSVGSHTILFQHDCVISFKYKRQHTGISLSLNLNFERRIAMSFKKIIAVTALILMASGIVLIDFAVAGEKRSAYGTSVVTKWHQIDVDKEAGHIIAVSEQAQVWFEKESGEKSTAVTKGIWDMNPKTMQFSLKGYSVRNYPNGEKWFSAYEGQPIGKDHWKGTFTYTGGTGQFEGLAGSGTWESWSLSQGVSYIEAEGERSDTGQ